MDYTPADGSVPKCMRLTIIAVYEDGSSAVSDIREPESVDLEILEVYSGKEYFDGVHLRDRVDTVKGIVEVKAKLGTTPMISIISSSPE